MPVLWSKISQDIQYDNDVCVYLENIATGQFNGDGEIYRDVQYYRQRSFHSLHMDRRVTAAQITVVYTFILANIFLIMYLTILRHKLWWMSKLTDKSKPFITQSPHSRTTSNARQQQYRYQIHGSKGGPWSSYLGFSMGTSFLEPNKEQSAPSKKEMKELWENSSVLNSYLDNNATMEFNSPKSGWEFMRVFKSSNRVPKR